MSLIHDVIKINMVREGYLPNYPPHLLSDNEMCDAFIKYPVNSQLTDDELWEQFKSDNSTMWFKDYYPLVNDTLESQYRTLVEAIAYHINKFKASGDQNRKLPNWVYSYMNNSVVSVDSSKLDIHDMLVMMGIDNIDDIFTPEAQAKCYEVSSLWVSKLVVTENDHRPASLFGEMHVLKSLRLQTIDYAKGVR